MDLAAAQRIPTGTPISRVIAKFGPPDGSHFDANGFQFLRWTQTRGSSAHSSRINGVVLRFDTNGRYAGVESYTLERVN
ncbi:MAG TPA: hypothetical protein VHN55_09805 [Sphingomicrobium sp.]|nr:hypothetical protein [Sphingomicrobium sp.]